MLADDVTVLALTDRGLESRQLYAAIRDAGFHPLMRLKQASALFRPHGWKRFHPLSQFARLGSYAAEGELYKGDPLPCRLLIRHDPQHSDAWILATDLAPARPAWYAFRCWIEQGFKDIKRGGYRWNRTRMEDPARVERVWLAMALAMLWTLEVGAAAEALVIDSLTPPASRHHSVFVRGWLTLLAIMLRRSGTHPLRGIVNRPPQLPDDPWPDGLPPPPEITEEEFLKQLKTSSS